MKARGVVEDQQQQIAATTSVGLQGATAAVATVLLLSLAGCAGALPSR